MTGCCAFGCTNRSEKGFKMYRFPADAGRKKIWENKVRRLRWKPSSTSFLCQEHFDHQQFENGRADGKKKLKCSAVPTLFSHGSSPKPRKSPKKRNVVVTEDNNVLKKVFLPDHNYCAVTQSDSSSSASKESSKEGEDIIQAVDVEARPRAKIDCSVEQPKADLRKTGRKCKEIVKAKVKWEARISRLFGRDQLEALKRRRMRAVEWSSATVKKALQLRFACGSAGYKLLLQQQYPLPSERALQRKMEKVPFQPGVLGQLFGFLKLKVQGLLNEERICCLTIEEMSLNPSVEFDVSSGNFLGNVTLPHHIGTADRALVFMPGGLTTRWKQIVAYHFTSSSTDGTVFKDIVLDIIQRAADIGLHMAAVTSGMGSANHAMWKSFGIVCGKHCRTVNRIPHPQAPGKWLHFLADVPHVFKNIKTALVNGQVFTLSHSTVKEHQLKSNVISMEPLHDLAKFQEDFDLKLTPTLTKAVLAPTHFDKMKVSNATRILSHDVSCGLTYLVNKEGRSDEDLTTAWLIEVLNHWFELMTSRHPVMALSRLHPDKYNEDVTFLRGVIKIFKDLKIGSDGEWKPIQTGVILSTTSVLDISEELLDAGHKFLLTSRLTQDCLENLFSVVRLRKPVPTAREFKYALRMISSAQFLTVPCTDSYQQDDGEFLAHFLNQPVRVPSNPPVGIIHFSDKQDVQDLPQAEHDSLSNLVLYCVHSVKKNEKTCDMCMKEMTAGPNDVACLSAGLALLKQYEKGCLVKVSDKVYDMLLQVESMFRNAESSLMEKTHVKKLLVEKAELQTRDFQLPTCHNLKHKLLTKFINTRLHFYCKKRSVELKKNMERMKKGGERGSKSMAM
uniref:THAP domain-containing protein 1 n=1 Tax=Eptatretus burgeri TaxID=7764 RepID=A0A8C4Q829_EPTBU